MNIYFLVEIPWDHEEPTALDIAIVMGSIERGIDKEGWIATVTPLEDSYAELAKGGK